VVEADELLWCGGRPLHAAVHVGAVEIHFVQAAHRKGTKGALEDAGRAERELSGRTTPATNHAAGQPPLACYIREIDAIVTQQTEVVEMTGVRGAEQVIEARGMTTATNTPLTTQLVHS